MHECIAIAYIRSYLTDSDIPSKTADIAVLADTDTDTRNWCSPNTPVATYACIHVKASY